MEIKYSLKRGEALEGLTYITLGSVLTYMKWILLLITVCSIGILFLCWGSSASFMLFILVLSSYFYWFLLIGLICFITAAITYRRFSKAMCQEESVSCADGILSFISNGRYRKELCKETRVISCGRMIILKNRSAAGLEAAQILPKRAFSDREEQERFIAMIKNSSRTELEAWRNEEAAYGFSFRKGADFYTETYSALNRIYGNKFQKNQIKLFIGTAFATIFLVLGINLDQKDGILLALPAIGLFIIAVFLYQIMFRRKSNQDRMQMAVSAKHIQTVKETLCFDETGIVRYQGVREAASLWEDVTEIIKTEAFILFLREQSSPEELCIPRKLFPDPESEDEFIQYCRGFVRTYRDASEENSKENRT